MKKTLYNLKKTWFYLKSQKIRLIIYGILNVINIIINLVIPIVGANIIVFLTDNKLKQVIYISIILLSIELLRSVVSYYTRTYSQIIYRESFKKIQMDLGSEILKIENKVLDKTSTGVFLERLSRDTSKLANVFDFLYHNLSSLLTDLGIFIAIFIISKPIFIFLLITIILEYTVEIKRIKILNANDKKNREKNEEVSGFASEIVRGLRDIKMLNAENSLMERLKLKINEINDDRYNMNYINRRYLLLIEAYELLMKTLLIIFLVILLKKNNITLASALIIYNYLPRASSVLYFLSRFTEGIKSYNLSAGRVFEIFDDDKFKKEVFGSKHVTKLNGDFVFKDVCFSYNDEKLLENINFEVKANQTVAFVGKSGSGKTTIFNLLCKMYDIKSGEILLDGININELDKDSIRGNITIISQNPYIFNMSFIDNFRLVKKDCTIEEIKEACKLACLDEFIESLPNKYETIVGEGGVNLSGGERQRLAIARAFVQKTEIILFDEATSALDNETQLKIQKAIENMKKEYTILIIAHRLSTVINSDKILFLNNGKIEKSGTHKELYKNYKPYRELYEAELSEN